MKTTDMINDIAKKDDDLIGWLLLILGVVVITLVQIWVIKGGTL
jgi:hypothetical protein